MADRNQAHLAGSHAHPSPVEEILGHIAASRRYRGVDAAIVRRIAMQAMEEAHGQVREGLKRTKRHLHRIFGAYLPTPPPYRQLREELRQAAAKGQQAVRISLRRIMGFHGSSRERLNILDRFYDDILSRTGRPSSIVELGCGLGPLAVPWMDLPDGCLNLRFCRQLIDRLKGSSPGV